MNQAKQLGVVGLGNLITTMLFLLSGCNEPLEIKYLQHPVFSGNEIQQLLNSSAVNMNDMLREKQLLLASGQLDNPYHPAKKMNLNSCWNDLNCRYSISETGIPNQSFPARSMVYNWWQQRLTAIDKTPVCGLRFIDERHTKYVLRNFNNLGELEATPDFLLTHYQQCGACSSLHDLAIYGTFDLTEMAKTCSKRADFAEKNSCMQDIGFSEHCATSWAYNAQQTAQSCFLVCIKEYGLLPLLTGTETGPLTNEQGELNACLLCDERMSGPGFQYSAGRTRRNSGIASEIDRPEEDVYFVPHQYF